MRVCLCRSVCRERGAHDPQRGNSWGWSTPGKQEGPHFWRDLGNSWMGCGSILPFALSKPKRWFPFPSIPQSYPYNNLTR